MWRCVYLYVRVCSVRICKSKEVGFESKAGNINANKRNGNIVKAKNLAFVSVTAVNAPSALIHGCVKKHSSC